MDGALNILKRFPAVGAPTAEAPGWSGRWWSVWGPSDIVPMGDKILLAAPGLANPFDKVAELTVTGPDEAKIAEAGAFDRYGETVRLVRGPDGAVTEVWIASGQMLPEAELVAELVARYGE